jgi:hypothetical protein
VRHRQRNIATPTGVPAIGFSIPVIVSLLQLEVITVHLLNEFFSYLLSIIRDLYSLFVDLTDQTIKSIPYSRKFCVSIIFDLFYICIQSGSFILKSI